MKKLLNIYIILFSFLTFSQKRDVDSIPQNTDEYILVKPGDSVVIQLNEITLLPRPKFNSKKDIRYYLWFRKKVYKVYPLAKLASERLDTLNARLERISSRRKRIKYIKLVQHYIEGEFTDQIKKMTTTEGRILLKLIHRQSGKTAYNNIKGLRSGWKAFWYNTTANIFKLSLKIEYHPESVNEDFLIENALQRAFQSGKLQIQESKLNFDFIKIITARKAIINVDEYKLMLDKMREKWNKKNKQKRRGK